MDDKKQEMKDKKQKYAYWMRPSLVDEMTEMLESANATSKSDFVCQAVEFYIHYPQLSEVNHKLDFLL